MKSPDLKPIIYTHRAESHVRLQGIDHRCRHNDPSVQLKEDVCRRARAMYVLYAKLCRWRGHCALDTHAISYDSFGMSSYLLISASY